MSKVRVAGFGVSIDGFGAGPDQSLENPLGIGGPELHNWFYPTRTFRSMLGKDDGTDDRFARAAMEGGTTFHFVAEGIEAALAQAKVAAGDLDVKICGGVSTVRQYLLTGAIDELHLALSPVLLGRGESLFAGIDLPTIGYRVTEVVPMELATHLVLTR
ncbi:MAG: deaminase [Sphingomonadales bacterium]|nr:deaminase [Sphingomonadales bacterium]